MCQSLTINTASSHLHEMAFHKEQALVSRQISIVAVGEIATNRIAVADYPIKPTHKCSQTPALSTFHLHLELSLDGSEIK